MQGERRQAGQRGNDEQKQNHNEKPEARSPKSEIRNCRSPVSVVRVGAWPRFGVPPSGGLVTQTAVAA
jgi:hypothetical protein